MAGTPIIRSPMKPSRKGEAPTYEWAKWVEKSLRRLIDEPPYRNRPINGGSGDKPPFWTEIYQIPDTDPPEYQVAVTLGYLSYQNATATEEEDGVTGWIAPKIQGDNGFVSLEPPGVGGEEWTAPKLALPALQSWVYLRVKTDSDGLPKLDGESVTVEAFAEKQESIHHIRYSEEGAEEDGDYYFLILETESDGGDPAKPVARRRITGNREMPNQLVEFENVFDDEDPSETPRKIYKRYLEGPDDKHLVRTLKQCAGRGEDLIKPLDPGRDAVPPVIAENGTVLKAGEDAVPPEAEGDSIFWRRIDGRATQAQIEVVATGDESEIIEVRGNGFDQPFVDVFGNGVQFQDGLAAFLIEGDNPQGGDDFNLQLLNVKITETSGEIFVSDIGWGTAPRFLHVRKGLLYLNDDGANVPIYDVISRIEGESDPSTTGESGPGYTPPS